MMRYQSVPWVSRHAGDHSVTAVVNWLFVMAGLVAIMVVIGGITRLTESGLSMVEWRPLIGALPPLNAAEWDRVYQLYRASPEYQQLNYGMTLAEFKTIFFWEYFHRLWGRLIGVAFALPLMMFALAGRVPTGFGLRLVVLLLLGGLQGVIGWWMVKSGLTEQASVSQYRLATHLGMALLIFALLLWTAFDMRDGHGSLPRGHGLASLSLLVVTILAGALVAGMNAGLLYNEYPFMGAGLVPVEYGEQGLVDPFENPAAAQFHHRWLAALTAGAVIALALKARRQGLLWQSHLVLAAILAQFTLGVLTLLHGVPVSLGGLHQAGAVILLGAVLALLHGQSRQAGQA